MPRNRKNNVVSMSPSETVELRPSADRQMMDKTAIARRAYEIYESRGASHGGDVDDWLEAERELCSANAKAS